MALRRFAQENNASASPRSPDGPSHTPRNRLSYGIHRSPADTPSISSSIPFDWAAARSRAPPPYATPLRSQARKSVGTGMPNGTPRKAVVRKKGILERVQNIPSNIAFEIALFPQNVPLPTPKTSARIIGGAIHLLHLCMHASNDSDINWDNIERTNSWFDWTTPVTILLIGFSIFNTYNLYTRAKSYKFHRRTEPLNSPNARFVTTSIDLDPIEQPPLSARIRSNLWFGFSFSWRFLLGFQAPKRAPLPREKTSRVQELEVWLPNEMELELFSIYSPAHAFLWLSMNSSNWIMIMIIMGLVGVQTNSLCMAYTQLVKDRQILSAETMKEYNDVFVYPRVNPIKRDVAVMTHQSEVVNVWER